jgi:hypothetical protein
MDEYLYDSQHHILGKVSKRWDNKLVLYDEHYQQMGFYDGNKNQTYDAYGKLLGEGNCLQDLPYVPRKLRFPLPEMSRGSFTIQRIKRAASQQYWDDGRCRICTKRGKRICFVQGLPGMCETCYRFFRMYSRTDSLELERKSRYRPITVQEIRKAVEKEKEPFLLAEQAADQAAKAALVAGVKELICTELSTEKRNVNVPKTQPSQVAISHSNPTTARKTEKKKRGLRWYHWVFIVVMGYVFFQIVLPVIGAYILWRMGYI